MKFYKFIKLVIVIILLVQSYSSVFCQENNRKIKSKKKYNVVFILQKDYKNSAIQISNLKAIIDNLPHNKKISVDNVYYYRSDINEINQYEGKTFDFNDDIFTKTSIAGKCVYEDIQSWFECGLKNYPLVKDFNSILIYNSSKETNIEYVKSFEQNYKIYSDINQLNLTVDSIVKTFKRKSKKNILIMHYYDFKPEVIVDKCDTIGIWISENQSILTPKIIDLLNDTVVRPTGNYAPSNDKCYIFKWTALPNINNYELYLNNIRFKVFVDKNKKYGTDVAYIKDGIVYFHLSVKSLGEKCSLEYKKYNSDCEDCGFDCIYTTVWDVKVRGYECDNYYCPFSQTIQGVLIQCNHGNQ